MASRKKATVIIYDMKNSSLLAKQFVLKFAVDHVFKEKAKHALFNLILMNCDAPRYRSSYENICDVLVNDDELWQKEPSLHNPEKLLEIIDNHKSSEEDADWIDALILATEFLKDFEKYKGNEVFQVLLISQFEHVKNSTEPFSGSLASTFEKLENFNAYIYIVGPSNPITSTIFTVEDIEQWTKQFILSDDKIPDIKHLANVKNCVICDETLASHLVHSYKSYKLSTQTWKVPLTIGSQLTFDCQVTVTGTLGKSYKCHSRRVKDVIWRNLNDPTIVYPIKEVINGYLRHGKFVEKPETKSMQLEGPRSFQVLGFTDSENVPEYITRSECAFVLPLKTNGIFTLINLLRARNQCIIARRVYNKNFNPRLAALVPHPTLPRLTLRPLPFLENLKQPDRDCKEDDYESVKHVEIDSQLEEFFKLFETNTISPRFIQHFQSNTVLTKCASKLFPNIANLFEELNYEVFPSKEGAVLDDGFWPARKPITKLARPEQAMDVDDDDDF